MNPSAQLDYQRETLRGLINHFVGGAGRFAAACNGETPEIDSDAPASDLVGDDPLGAFDGAIANSRGLASI